MFPNLNAEQARAGMTDEAVAKTIGISRATYAAKKANGSFKCPEIWALCKLFNVSFEILFYSKRGA